MADATPKGRASTDWATEHAATVRLGSLTLVRLAAKVRARLPFFDVNCADEVAPHIFWLRCKRVRER